MVAKYIAPDNTAQTGAPYKSNLDNAIVAGARIAVAFLPQAQTVPNMTVRVLAGVLMTGGVLTEVAAQNSATIAAPTTNPRIDRIVLNPATGAIERVAGTEAVSPVAPAIPADRLPICRFQLATSTTAITDAMIVDERVVVAVLPDGSVTTVKLADGAMTPAKLDATGTFTMAAVRASDVGTGAASNLSLTTSGGTQARVDHVASANRAVVLAGSNGGNPLVTTTAGALTLSGAGGPLTYIYSDGFVEINHNVAGTNGLRVWASNASFTQNVFQPWTTKAAATDFDLIEAISGNGSDVEFRVRGDGQVTADGSFTGGGADYAEFFEWADGNPSNEDRVGFPVVLHGAKIRKATNADPASSIIGVVSGNPSVLGDAAWNKWSGKHVRDDFGRYVWEDYEIVSWTTVEQLPVEEGEEPRAREVEHSYALGALPSGVTVPQDATYSTARRRTLSPDFDPAAPYVPRSERPEWSPIGLLGKLRLRKGQPAGDRWIKLRDVSAAVEEWLVR